MNSDATIENSVEHGEKTVLETAIVLRTLDYSVGHIDTNIVQVLEAVRRKSEQYQDVAKYHGDEKQAKDDRALLRKQKEATKTMIESIKEAWNTPLEKFIAGSKEVLRQFDYAIDAIDDWVKEGEAREKAKKRQEIESYFNSKEFDLVPLDRFFNDKWLNKGAKMPEIKKEIDDTIAAIYANLKVLEGIAEFGIMVKALYLETLDMGAAMRQVTTLKANAERLAREQAEREERKLQEQVRENQREAVREEQESRRDMRVNDLAHQALDLPEEPPPAAADKPQIIEFVCRFWGTEDNLRAMRGWMSAHNVAYQKGMIFGNDDAADLFMRQHNIAGTIESLIFIEAIKQ